MTVPVWPGTVPYKPLRDAYDVPQPYSPPAVSEVEDGPPIMRQWGTADWTKVNYQLVLTYAQYDTFDTFVRGTLNRGTKRFTMPMKRPGGASWNSKLVFLDGGKFTGPKPYGKDTVVVSFVLNVQGW